MSGKNPTIIPTTFHLEKANDRILENSLKVLRKYAEGQGMLKPKKKDVINYMIGKVGIVNPEEFFK
jgi:hypothetical protein